MFHAAVFDLDGTLLNTLDDLADSTNAALLSFGKEPVTTQMVRASVGNGVDVLFEKVLPDGRQDSRYDELIRFFVPYYTQHCRIKTGPYPGIMEMLGALRDKGVRMAIVSNKADPAVRVLSEEFFNGYVAEAVGESKEIRKKPCPDTVLKALRLLDVKPEEALYIGDSEVDHETAKNAGIKVALVTWGFRDRDELEKMEPDYLIDDPMQLAALF